MKANNNQTLSEVIKYYDDFDGQLEESLFNWLIERAKKAEHFELALREIAEEKDTPCSKVAEKALKD